MRTLSPGRAVHVTVPASTANLGSGFDALGLALALYDEVDVAVTDAGVRVAVEGCGAGQVPTDERHLVVRALRETLRELGFAAPGLSLSCRNVIPHSRGLGSSAAAVVAGVAAGFALAGIPRDDRALQLAASFEGHADNAGASLYGGLVIAFRDDDGFRAARLTPHLDLLPTAFVPDKESSTASTRGLLPATVPHADAVFAAGRAALAVHALTVAPEFLLVAMEDRLHQHYREAAWPETIRLVERLRALGIPAAVSGAGPTVFALPANDLPGELDMTGFTPHRLAVDHGGARTVERG